MSKLTKAQFKKHAEAEALLQKEHLTFDERWFVLENWNEGANHINSEAGAFFTPILLARDFALEVGGGRVVDLCAGIGMLAFHVYHRSCWSGEPKVEIVCIEKNPDYVRVGRKVLPEATWILADVFDLPDLGRFDVAIGNPPFGRTPRSGSGPRYTGPAFEFHVMDIAADLADRGVFLIPQSSASFTYSGSTHYVERRSKDCQRFEDQARATMGPNCGIDTEAYRADWRGVSPTVEIVCVDYEKPQIRVVEPPKPSCAAHPVQGDLFDLLAA